MDGGKVRAACPQPTWETWALGGVRVMEPGETSMEWSTRRSMAPGNMGGPDKRKCDKELGFEIDLPSLTEKDGTIKISSEAQL